MIRPLRVRVRSGKRMRLLSGVLSSPTPAMRSLRSLPVRCSAVGQSIGGVALSVLRAAPTGECRPKTVDRAFADRAAPGDKASATWVRSISISTRSLGGGRDRRRYLVERALMGTLVGTPPQQFYAMAKAIARHMIEADFDDEFRLQSLPLAATLGAPAARTPGRLTRKTRRLPQGFQSTG